MRYGKKDDCLQLFLKIIFFASFINYSHAFVQAANFYDESLKLTKLVITCNSKLLNIGRTFQELKNTFRKFKLAALLS